MCEHLIRKLQFLATAEDATGMNDSAIAMREAATALERLRKDAERYRWLREQHWSEAEICVVTNPKDAIKLGYYCPSSVRLDSAIDAAIAGEKK